jgi:hypothetical protein
MGSLGQGSREPEAIPSENQATVPPLRALHAWTHLILPTRRLLLSRSLCNERVITRSTCYTSLGVLGPGKLANRTEFLEIPVVTELTFLWGRKVANK